MESISKHPKLIDGVIKRLNSAGYIQVKVGTRWQEEHRLVVENILNRILEPTEVVHHIDFNKQNNNPDNLALFSSPVEHAHWHRQVRQFGWTNPLRQIINSHRVSNFKRVTKV